MSLSAGHVALAARPKIAAGRGADAGKSASGYDRSVSFSEIVRLLEDNGFRLVKEKGSIRYYAKPGHPKLVRVDFHGRREVPTGTMHAILKSAGIKR